MNGIRTIDALITNNNFNVKTIALPFSNPFRTVIFVLHKEEHLERYTSWDIRFDCDQNT